MRGFVEAFRPARLVDGSTVYSPAIGKIAKAAQDAKPFDRLPRSLLGGEDACGLVAAAAQLNIVVDVVEKVYSGHGLPRIISPQVGGNVSNTVQV
jgi:hypothetical protein